MRQMATALMSEEEYIQHELKSERRSEYINGQLFEMPGEQDINNRLSMRLYMMLYHLESQGYFLYTHEVKIAIPGRKKYRYPDFFITAEPETSETRYIKRKPTLIVEVVSEGSDKTDYIDKLIEYTTIPSLLYYLIVEPETILVTVCEREGDDWVSHKFTSLDDTIQLSKLNVTLPMAALYKSIKR